MSPIALEKFMEELPATMPKVDKRNRSLMKAVKLTKTAAKPTPAPVVSDRVLPPRQVGITAAEVQPRTIPKEQTELAVSLNARVLELQRYNQKLIDSQAEDLRKRADAAEERARVQAEALETGRKEHAKQMADVATDLATKAAEADVLRRQQQLEDRQARKQEHDALLQARKEERAAHDLHTQELVTPKSS